MADLIHCFSESGVAMKHYSCDHCGKDLIPGTDTRYIVKMDVYRAEQTSQLTADDLDADHLAELAQFLENTKVVGPLPPDRSQFLYDLCVECYKKFLADPLSRESQKFNFSAN